MTRTEAELGRTMSSREFTDWQAFYDLKAQIANVRSSHPTWPVQQVLEWVEAQISLRGKKG